MKRLHDIYRPKEERKSDWKRAYKGKNVLMIGGGDTGSDCVGTSIRQGAAGASLVVRALASGKSLKI